jgi:hypothetical protein
MITMDATEAARAIRADLRAAVKNGEFGELPAGASISVRARYASCMSEVLVTIKGEQARAWAIAGTRLSDAAAETARRLMAIVDRHFDYDGRQRFAGVSLESGICLA